MEDTLYQKTEHENRQSDEDTVDEDSVEESDERIRQQYESDDELYWSWPDRDCWIQKICPSQRPFDGCFLLISATVFVIGGLLLILTIFLPMAVANPTYQEGSCYGARGASVLKQCSVNDCPYCRQDCWMAYAGVSAVPNVTVYFFMGTYDDYGKVRKIITGNIGHFLGKCWYKDDGKDIMFSLYPTDVVLFISMVIIGIGVVQGVALLLCGCIKFKLYRYFVSACQACGRSVRSRFRRKQGYTDMDSTPLEVKDNSS